MNRECPLCKGRMTTAMGKDIVVCLKCNYVKWLNDSKEIGVSVGLKQCVKDEYREIVRYKEVIENEAK